MSRYAGRVTAAKDWGLPSQTFTLSEAEPGSYEAVLHRAVPAVRRRLEAERKLAGRSELNSLLLVFNGAGEGDEKQQVRNSFTSFPKSHRPSWELAGGGRWRSCAVLFKVALRALLVKRRM